MESARVGETLGGRDIHHCQGDHQHPKSYDVVARPNRCYSRQKNVKSVTFAKRPTERSIPGVPRFSSWSAVDKKSAGSREGSPHSGRTEC